MGLLLIRDLNGLVNKVALNYHPAPQIRFRERGQSVLLQTSQSPAPLQNPTYALGTVTAPLRGAE